MTGEEDEETKRSNSLEMPKDYCSERRVASISKKLGLRESDYHNNLLIAGASEEG
jgi:hypothetical protein